MEQEKKKLNPKIIIAVIIAIVAISIILILANNTKTIVIQTPNSNKYTISGEVVELHDLEQSIVSYQNEIIYLGTKESKRENSFLGWAKPKYSFEQLEKMFETDYEKVCKIYDKAYKQVENNVKVSIPMENYKKCLDIIHEGFTSGKLYEECDNEKYLQAITDLGTTGTDFIMNFSDEYGK